MSNHTLIWCHGSLGKPWGTKSTALGETAKELGLTMDAPDFRDTENPDQRVDKLVDILEAADTPVILAGSSMGGYVAAAAAKRIEVQGLFLVAPAFYFPGYDVHVFSNLPSALTLVHGWSDDVVPVENSIRFAKTHKATLHIIEDDHRLQGSTEQLCSLFAGFLKNAAKLT